MKLLIERNSKSKLVYSNMSESVNIIFENSRWADYSSFNIYQTLKTCQKVSKSISHKKERKQTFIQHVQSMENNF